VRPPAATPHPKQLPMLAPFLKRTPHIDGTDGRGDFGIRPMDPRSYSGLAAAVFALVALLQIVRATSGWPVSIGGTSVPLWASWLVVLVAGIMALLGFSAARR
jgi:hypothetical protein